MPTTRVSYDCTVSTLCSSRWKYRLTVITNGTKFGKSNDLIIIEYLAMTWIYTFVRYVFERLRYVRHLTNECRS